VTVRVRFADRHSVMRSWKLLFIFVSSSGAQSGDKIACPSSAGAVNVEMLRRLRAAFRKLLLGRGAASCEAIAALPTDRPIRDARVPHAIGQSFDWLVPAEAEVVGARAADRPAMITSLLHTARRNGEHEVFGATQLFLYLVFGVIEPLRTNKPAPRPLLSR
jgi:hypothetical protein